MKRKQTVRMVVDAAMTVALLLLMGYSRIGEEAHEWLGIGMTVLFILHHMLNRKWIAALFRGKYTAYRVLQTLLACVIFVGLAVSAYTGIMLSKHVFRFLGFTTGMADARELHLRSGYWNFILLSLHLGLHWILIIGLIGKRCKNKSALLKWLVRLLAAGIAAYGIHALLSRNVPDYLFGTIGFAFVDETEPVARFLLDWLAIMGLFVCIGHYGAKLLRSTARILKRQQKIERNENNMKKDLGLVQAVYPMPVLMVAAYDENEKVNVMNVAWGQICDEDKLILFIGAGKRTWLNIQASKAFTVALADEAHVDVADFFGIASGNRMADKFERTGYHAVPSDKVHAPIIEEFPVVMECELLEFLHTDHVDGIVGKIVNVKAEEAVLDEKGKVDVAKLHALMFDQFRNGYYATGEKVAQAWNAGAGLMKK